MFTFVVYLNLGAFVALTVLTFVHYMRVIRRRIVRGQKNAQTELTFSVGNITIINESKKQFLTALKYFEAYSNLKYFKADGKTIIVVYEKRKYLMRGTMGECEKHLLNKGFIRINKDYLVNYRFIESLDKENSVVRLTGGEELPINSNMSSKIIKQIQTLPKNMGI